MASAKKTLYKVVLFPSNIFSNPKMIKGVHKTASKNMILKLYTIT